MDNLSPKNMQELLKFAIKHQKSGEQQDVQVDEEKRLFLDHVLQSMSVNVMEEFLKAVGILQDESSSDEAKVEALELIRHYIDNIDFANSFIKIEGADILLKCVQNVNANVCLAAIRTIAEMAQNNQLCQQYFLEYGIIEQLIKFLKNDDPEVVAAALYALSALIRNYEPALVEFIKKDGVKQANDCLNAEFSRIISKTCFLIASISTEFPLIKDEFAKLGVFNTLAKKLRIASGYVVETEMALRCMSVMIESRYYNPSIDEIKYVADILKNIVINNTDLPECEEIVSYSKSLLNHLENR